MLFQTGMRSYLLNGGSSVGVGTPPPGPGMGPPRHHRPGLMSGRASSSSLPRSPEQDLSHNTSGLGTGSVSGQSGHGSLGSHSSHEVNYMNIYQNTNTNHTNHHNIYVSTNQSPYQPINSTSKRQIENDASSPRQNYQLLEIQV